MDLTWSPEEEAFRAEVRAWLQDNVPEHDEVGGGEFDDDDASFTFRRDWQRKLGEAGYLAPHWPKAYGGAGMSLVEQVILSEEMAKAKAPHVVNGLGINLVGPTLITAGTDAQRERFLRKILEAEEIWCQGYSEPNAGSDLAGLQTKAELVGDEWVINGQKIWTSLARFADWIFVLCRTDPEVRKHAGISYLLCPMDQPGIEVRPIRQINGSSAFAEVFFTDARTAADNVVGEVNDGWRVAMTTLMFERGGDVLANAVSFRRMATQLYELAADVQRNGRRAIEDPVVRDRIGRSVVEVEIMRLNGLRSISPRLHGETPGPESSMGKLYWSEWYQRATELAMDVLGAEGLDLAGAETEGYFGRRWVDEYLSARSTTIYAGTSEVQRNILAERVLGLPRGGRA